LSSLRKARVIRSATPMLIRPATPADLPAVQMLEQQTDSAAHWSERDYAALFSPDAPKRLALVAEDVEQLCGFIIARCGVDEWEIENVVIAPSHRRKGIGSELVRRVVQQAGELPVLLEVRQSNTPARQLYQQLGFREIGRRVDYYREPAEDALVLRFPPEKL